MARQQSHGGEDDGQPQEKTGGDQRRGRRGILRRYPLVAQNAPAHKAADHQPEPKRLPQAGCSYARSEEIPQRQPPTDQTEGENIVRRDGGVADGSQEDAEKNCRQGNSGDVRKGRVETQALETITQDMYGDQQTERSSRRPRQDRDCLCVSA